MNTANPSLLAGFFLLCIAPLAGQNLSKALVSPHAVFEEKNGIVAVEAEYFYKQTATETRRWYHTFAGRVPNVGRDPDEAHLTGASKHAYLEILPDTRTTHEDELISGTNFMNEPGNMAILHYKVYIHQPGRYYVWVRAYSTGTEDNGLHVGIDGSWPEHGRRMQWTAKRQWFWDNKQRTQEVHTGIPMEIYLDIAAAGEHEIQFSMREDGFEFDKFLLVRDPDFRPGQGKGPEVVLRAGALPAFPRPHGKGTVEIGGELKQWHKLTLSLEGPFANEADEEPNPFTDYELKVVFTHESGSPSYVVPGYFAADGQAAETGATEGRIWRAHFSPDKAGNWSYEVSFRKGKYVALMAVPWAEELAPFHGLSGSIAVGKTDKSGRDFRAKGRLEYVRKHFLQFRGSGEYFLKAGADSPETLLAYRDFDGTYTARQPLKSWEPHVQDWREGDPLWQGNKGKGVIGAINYLAGKGVNACSFLTYNAGGDGDNVWPFVSRNDKYHYDCSKLDQWQLVFDHAQQMGMYLHFKTQETENDDHRRGGNPTGLVPESLDGGQLGPQRMLYYRELIARFGYLLALNWNLGEENSQTTQQRKEMAAFFARIDPYSHNIVLHTFPNQQARVYEPLLGQSSELTGFSLQNHWNHTHARTLEWVKASARAGKPLVIANDEQGPASHGVPPDPSYPGFEPGAIDYDLHDIRKQSLWGNLMAGGAGVEYYFGYQFPQNDLNCEDFRSRDKSWEYAAIALDFFSSHQIPFWEMSNQNALIGNPENHKEKYCLAKKGELYLVYLAYAETSSLDLSAEAGRFEVWWFNPREGGPLRRGSRQKLRAGKVVELGLPPGDRDEDWLAVIRRQAPDP